MTIPTILSTLVFEVADFVTPAFCQRMITLAESTGFQTATITTEHGTAQVPDIRNNDRVIMDDEGLAAELWDKAAPLFDAPFKGHKAIGLNERLRLYRYDPGQFFDWHQDGSFQRSPDITSQFTMMIYLNSDMTGGGTSFADVFSPHVFADFSIQPQTGKALLFHHPLSHRGDAVESGRKYVLRTDVMFAPL